MTPQTNTTVPVGEKRAKATSPTRSPKEEKQKSKREVYSKEIEEKLAIISGLDKEKKEI